MIKIKNKHLIIFLLPQYSRYYFSFLLFYFRKHLVAIQLKHTIQNLLIQLPLHLMNIIMTLLIHSQNSHTAAQYKMEHHHRLKQLHLIQQMHIIQVIQTFLGIIIKDHIF